MLAEGTLGRKFPREREKVASFDGVDLRGDTFRSTVDEVCRLIDDTGVDVLSNGRRPTWWLAPTVARRSEAVPTIRGRLECAAAVGAHWLVVVLISGEAAIGAAWPGGVEEAESELLVIQLSELAAAADEHRRQILLEPLNQRETHLLRFRTNAGNVASLAASPWLATMADTHHIDLQGQDMVGEITAARERLRLVNVFDYYSTVPVKGGIDFAPLLGTLAAGGYDGYLGFECRGPLYRDDLQRSFEYVRSLL